MKLNFVRTQNVSEFVNVATKLQNVEAGVPGMGLVHGSRGFGKTSASMHYTAQKENTSVYLLAKADWTFGWMMEEICIELGITPRRGAKAKYDDCVSALVEKPRLVVIDESNLIKPALLETLRGIHDATHNPILFVGHEGVVDKFRRLGPLFDRLLYLTEFKPLSITDLRHFAENSLELAVEMNVLEKVLKKTGGNFRKSVVALKGLEDRAKADRSLKISLKHVDLQRAA